MGETPQINSSNRTKAIGSSSTAGGISVSSFSSPQNPVSRPKLELELEPTGTENQRPKLSLDDTETARLAPQHPTRDRSTGQPRGGQPSGGRHSVDLDNSPDGPLQLVRLGVQIPEGTDTAAVARSLNNLSNDKRTALSRLVPQLREKLEKQYYILTTLYMEDQSQKVTPEVVEFIKAYRQMKTDKNWTSPVFDSNTANTLNKLWGVFGYSAPKGTNGVTQFDSTSLALMDFMEGNLIGAQAAIKGVKTSNNPAQANQLSALASIIMPYDKNSNNKQIKAQAGNIEAIRTSFSNLQNSNYLEELDTTILSKLGKDTNDPAYVEAWKRQSAKQSSMAASINGARKRLEIKDPGYDEERYSEYGPYGAQGGISNLGLGSGALGASYSYNPSYGAPETSIGQYDPIIEPQGLDPKNIPNTIQNYLTFNRHQTLLWFTMRNMGTFQWQDEKGSGYRDPYSFLGKLKTSGVLARDTPYGDTPKKFGAGRDDSPADDNAWDIKAIKSTSVRAMQNGFVLSAQRHIPVGNSSNRGYGNHIVVWYPDPKDQESGLLVFHAHLEGINPDLVQKLQANNGQPIPVSANAKLAQTGNTGQSEGRNGGYHDHMSVVRVEKGMGKVRE